MAITLRGKSKCPICESVLEAGQELVSTTHFISSPSHPLWRYSDAAMHYNCFQTWEHREAFVSEFNDTVGRIVWGNGTRHYMQGDGIIVVANADGNR